MVLCFDPFVHSDNMYPSSSNRHTAAASQNFALGPYGFSSQQAASQYATGVSDSMGCPVAQYQMSAAGLSGMSPESLQQSPTSWHAPAAMHYMSSCSRTPHHVPFDEWPSSVQSQTTSPNSCAHVPSAVGMPSSSSSPIAPSCHFAGHSYKLTNGPSSNGGGGSPVTTVVSAAPTTATLSDYSGQVQVQDLTCGGGGSTGGGGGGGGAGGGGNGSGGTAGHHSPDSGLTVSSDGVSSSGSPQLVIVPPTNHHHHVVHHGRHVSAPHHHHHPFHSQTQVMNRPTPVRSPFEWMKTKPNYQNSHPNPGNGRSKGLDALIPGDIGKTRTKDKYRVVYSDHQRLELEKEFHYSRYITIRRKAELAQMLGLSERQVKIWFQNRRAKERKQGKKRDELKIKDTSSPLGHHHHHHQTHHHHVPGHLQPPPPNALMTTKVIHLD